jgi:hypothetical protein
MALSDWSWEMRLLQAARGLAIVSPQAGHVRAADGCPVCSAKATTAAPVSQELGTKAKKPAAAGAGRARKEGDADATD